MRPRLLLHLLAEGERGGFRASAQANSCQQPRAGVCEDMDFLLFGVYVYINL